jgi:hypothetical protein
MSFNPVHPEVGQTNVHPASFLPNCGLNHSFADLDRVKGYIHTLPAEQQAQYADQWCRMKATDLTFATQQAETPDGPQYEMWNTTAVGNMAYMSLHAPTPELRSKYCNLLEGYCQWRSDNEITCTIC